MDTKNNIYGVQKIDEPEVRNGRDIAVGVTTAAAQGAKIGSKFGPWGTAAGALGFGAYSLAQQQKAQRQEKEYERSVDAHNEYVDNLEGRDVRNTNLVRAQAKYGMNSNSKYEVAEIEGDGSGSAYGVGEIHVDRNYNIKNVAKGAAKHEEGGYEINNLEKDDIIFPTQNSKKEYNKVMGAIKRWKLNRDPRAKKYLDRLRDSLPTDEDYGYADDKEYSDGKGTAMSKKDQLRKIIQAGDLNYSRRDLRKMTDEDAETILMNFYDKDPGTFEEKYPEVFKASNFTREETIPESQIQADSSMPDFLQDDFDNYAQVMDKSSKTPSEQAADIGKNTQPKIGSPITGSGSMQKKKNETLNENPSNAWDTLFDKSKTWSPADLQKYAQDNNLNYTDIEKEASARGINIPDGTLGKGSQNRSVNWGPKTANFFSQDVGTTPTSQLKQVKKAVSPAQMQNQAQNKYQANPTTEDVSTADPNLPASDYNPYALSYDDTDPLREPGTTLSDDGTVLDPNGKVKGYYDDDGNYTSFKDKKDQERDYQEEAWKDINTIEDRTNPLKYTSTLNKLATGNKPADKVTRRYFTPEEYEYQDRSAAKRAANVENRNFRANQLRGKGMSAGQINSYSGQIGSRYLNTAEQINETEAQRADQVDFQNVGVRNQAGQANITLANQYDLQDDQNEAARRRYVDEGMSDISKFALLDEQKRYMMDRDRKKNKMQMATVGLTGTEKFGFDPNNPFKVKYVK